jgi:hypothetical protein
VLERIVSGGQTGVDRAALEAAQAAGLARGGWCPRGRAAEDGPVPAHHPLRETPDRDPDQRTAWNVRDSDATLVLLRGPARGGTRLTLERAREAGRPLRVVRLDARPQPSEVALWLAQTRCRVLNVAGPRESEEPGIQAEARRFLDALLAVFPAPRRRSPPGGTKPSAR